MQIETQVGNGDVDYKKKSIILSERLIFNAMYMQVQKKIVTTQAFI